MSEPNVFSQSFEDLVRNVGVKAQNETTTSNVEAPKTEAPKTEAPKTEAPKTEAPKTEAPKTEAPKTEAPKTEAPKTEAPKEPTTDDYKVDVDVFGQQAAVDPINTTATPAKDIAEKDEKKAVTNVPEKPAEQPKPKVNVPNKPVVEEKEEVSKKKPAKRAKRAHRNTKKTEPVSKDAITITVPLNSKVAALLDDDELLKIKENAEAAIDAEIKTAVKAAAEALINEL